MKFCRLAVLICVLVCVCDGVHVTVQEEQQFAMLFQTVVLPCQYHTASTKTPVVQWWYKSYCRDRTQESFSPSTLGAMGSALGAQSHLECSDTSRTVRIVASGQGPSMTLAEHYKGRDIAIVDKSNLRIGELQWGDSGVYFCKIVIPDDLEGKNEGQVELLVLGRTGEQHDILPEFDVEIMPEWVFVGCVALGSVLFLLLLGVCWCQCCPHSCCCYLRCCCCPETCCCPRHLYEAGKMAKTGQLPQTLQPSQVPVYPYYIPGVPTLVPLAPPAHAEPKMSSFPSIENNLAAARSGYRHQANEALYRVEKELAKFPSTKMVTLQPRSLSELSSLHEGGNVDFRHTYQTVQMKALPSIVDLDDQSAHRAAPPTQGRRGRRLRGNQSDNELDRSRWNPRSEHLQRKTLGSRGRTGSLDELEEFARSYGGTRAGRGDPRDRDYDRDSPGGSPPRRFRREEYADDDGDWRRRSPSLEKKRRGTWDSDRPSRPSDRRARDDRGYDDGFLSSVLDSKVRGRAGRVGGGGGRPEEDSDTPSKGSSRGKGSDCYYSRSSSNRPEEEDSLPPYSELEGERYRRAEVSSDRYRDVEPASKERYRTVEPPSSERYRTVEPPSNERYRTVEPPSNERYRTAEPPSKERYRAVEPPSNERYRAAEPPTREVLRTAEPSGNQRYRTVEPPGTERYRTADPDARPFSYLPAPQRGPHHALPGGREELERNRNLSHALSRDNLIV
ncbi:immunoglobulin-like domain-containing receptor 2 isoform X1 [Gadus morhua]|uniref:immunoglobulin-like domain-containing receptor 2 isoform X1 n=1 Tax=Gadus morhua TaxID=8049 RepID=UPI0011B47E7C|nr:immunoglobulin-like domain-containing receptor 2 isoform X1 [Gadus morhua]